MRQEDWVIETGDGHKIYGITDFADDSKKSEKCLCLVHGLTGGADEYLLKTAACVCKVHSLNERQFVEGADHCFHRGNSLDKLLGLASHWFERV
ncbi:MAG: hypothetical protein H6857_00440 [Rhodospirillales bacterium]|nr:hypothetical protein [Rhodospirillales bacterium]